MPSDQPVPIPFAFIHAMSLAKGAPGVGVLENLRHKVRAKRGWGKWQTWNFHSSGGCVWGLGEGVGGSAGIESHWRCGSRAALPIQTHYPTPTGSKTVCCRQNRYALPKSFALPRTFLHPITIRPTYTNKFDRIYGISTQTSRTATKIAAGTSRYCQKFLLWFASNSKV